MAAAVSYPINDKNDVIEYSSPIMEDTMTILSFYNKSNIEDRQIKDILFMFNTIPISLWLLLLLSYFAFICVFDYGKRIVDRKSKLDAMWTTTCSFLHQKEFPSNRRYLVVLSLFTCIGIFFALSYITNNVSTDLVVLKEPIVIKNYDDIIERDVTVITSRKAPETESLINAPPGSKLWKMFQKVVWAVTEMGDDRLLKLQQDPVLIGREPYCKGNGYFVMGLSERKYPNVRALIVQDPDAGRFTNIHVYRKDVPKYVSNILDSM